MKKLDNIATGEVFKNYSALCTALDEPQKTGKSKQLAFRLAKIFRL